MLLPQMFRQLVLKARVRIPTMNVRLGFDIPTASQTQQPAVSQPLNPETTLKFKGSARMSRSPGPLAPLAPLFTRTETYYLLPTTHHPPITLASRNNHLTPRKYINIPPHDTVPATISTSSPQPHFTPSRCDLNVILCQTQERHVIGTGGKICFVACRPGNLTLSTTFVFFHQENTKGVRARMYVQGWLRH